MQIRISKIIVFLSKQEEMTIYKTFAGKNLDNDVYGGDLDKIIEQKNRFVADKGFSGAEGSSRGSGPVQVSQLICCQKF